MSSEKGLFVNGGHRVTCHHADMDIPLLRYDILGRRMDVRLGPPPSYDEVMNASAVAPTFVREYSPDRLRETSPGRLRDQEHLEKERADRMDIIHAREDQQMREKVYQQQQQCQHATRVVSSLCATPAGLFRDQETEEWRQRMHREIAAEEEELRQARERAKQASWQDKVGSEGASIPPQPPTPEYVRKASFPWAPL